MGFILYIGEKNMPEGVKEEISAHFPQQARRFRRWPSSTVNLPRNQCSGNIRFYQ
ncbi:hypothetical protein SOD10_04970 [Serratia plymuthica]|uniref:Uncharacterized protein n=1 Tax=Serratia plymuthica S13 TaxID=1348660 RepID=S4YPM7_SERPL|nr:hypothetical protein M621_19080 [Serratia plymuthica S13]KYG18279.1 hypothetical protein SOD10_04970 [Serratia plymuthica]